MLIAIDIETTGLDFLRDEIYGVGIVSDCGRLSGFYRVNEIGESIRKELRSPANTIVGHNLRFDLSFLAQHGIYVSSNRHDTRLIAQLLDENRKLGLKALSQESQLQNKNLLDEKMNECGYTNLGLFIKDKGNLPEVAELIRRYCLEDCQNTLSLFKKLYADLKKDKMLLSYYEDEARPLELVLLKMELAGLRFDASTAKQIVSNLLKEKDELEIRIRRENQEAIQLFEDMLYRQQVAKRKSERGKRLVQKQSAKYKTRFLLSSVQHVAWLVYQYYKCPVLKTTKTGLPDVSSSGLLRAARYDKKAHAFINQYLIWKKIEKMAGTYLKGIIDRAIGGRVYPLYLQTGRGKEAKSGGTVTGRLSSQNPNIQNLPRDKSLCDVASLFLPDSKDFVFVYFDYSQIELRIAAHLSKDPLLIAAYAKNKDVHRQTASAIFSKPEAEITGEERQKAKAVNFALIYMAGPYRLSQMLECSVDMARTFRERFFKLYSTYHRYLTAQIDTMTRTGMVRSEAGRIRRLPALLKYSSDSREYQHAIKQGLNFPIQSLGASITKRAMLALDAAGYKVVTQVHDSVVVQVPKTMALFHAERIREIATGSYKLRVPLEIDLKFLTSLSQNDTIDLRKEVSNGCIVKRLEESC